jgi:hypothetical protein
MMAKSIYRLYKDLLLLETFAIMTYCSFSKILKKHDKVTGHSTRAAFMSNVVNKVSGAKSFISSQRRWRGLTFRLYHQCNFASYPGVLGMITRCEQMYEEVSNRLLQEGKSELYEDERLFISMINRLNEQALEIEDAPDQGRRPKKIAIAAPCPNQPESTAISTLRSLVEESEARASGHVRDLHTSDRNDDDDQALKRNSEEVELRMPPDEKRAKLPS